jgi:hypothetical protein
VAEGTNNGQELASLVADQLTEQRIQDEIKEWEFKASCRELSNQEVDLLFSDHPIGSEEDIFIRQMCGQCVVSVECLTTAIANKMECGYWGGLKFSERKYFTKKLLAPELKRRRDNST